MKKILCTCPPMIRQIHQMKPWLASLHFEIDIPEFTQTLPEETLIEIVPEYDGWIIGDDPATARVFRSASQGRLKAAVKWGAGTDNVDFAGAKAAGIPITNTPGTFGEEVSDVAIGYLIALSRSLFEIDRGVRKKLWPKPSGMSLAGKNVGVVGLGHIGKCLIRKLPIFGLNIIGYDPYTPIEETPNIERSEWPAHIHELDYLILCCQLTPDTHHLINAGSLSNLKSSASLINVSRGGLVDEEALIIALREGQIHSAALEVFENEPLPKDSPLRDFDHVVFGSHNSSNTVEAVLKTSRIAIDTLAKFLSK